MRKFGVFPAKCTIPYSVKFMRQTIKKAKAEVRAYNRKSLEAEGYTYTFCNKKQQDCLKNPGRCTYCEW